MKKATLDQAVQVLDLFRAKKTPLKQVQKILASGLLADLCDANIDQIDRVAFRSLCGLNPIGETTSASKEEAALDTLIHIDRSVRPVYPDWTKVVMHPELETVGPSDYDLAKIELYLHDGQKNGKWMKGERIYEYLKETDTLKACLGLHDVVEIQKKGVAVFRKLFGNRTVFCWKSVVRNSSGSLIVPCVCVRGDKVVLYWVWLDSDWYDNRPAARFASST